ncbi:MAG TPA: type II toxin-antitoxin system VapB family antitoxin [Sphingomonas sp.]|jgi:antitoxin VapB|nr:type II toxin-antitoxin system VapB family antitoxin [Sphingomonas sp.]
MASLFIKDTQTAEQVRTLAKRLGSTQTEVVRRAVSALERELAPHDDVQRPDFVSWIARHRRENPLPAPTGAKADKAFFDAMWGEPD